MHNSWELYLFIAVCYEYPWKISKRQKNSSNRNECAPHLITQNLLKKRRNFLKLNFLIKLTTIFMIYLHYVFHNAYGSILYILGKWALSGQSYTPK